MDVIMDMKSTSVASLTNVRLFEWRGTVRDLIKLGMAVTFLRLHLHLRHIAMEWFIWTQIVFLKNQISKWKAELAFMLLRKYSR
uniref:Uncharacterized protein n=1 Tax=Quercus lobata TaxID=97700 RepID=A0A7N2R9S0_QUELO